MDPDLEAEKRLAATAAAGLVEESMTVGLGTGSTVAHLLSALARRRLDIRCVATSPATARAAARLGLLVESFTSARLDIAIDGADQIDPAGWLMKGGGGAQTREKLVATAADVFVVIADSTKTVPVLRPPVPVEVLSFGVEATLARIGRVLRRDTPPTPDGGILVDILDGFDDPATLAAQLDATPGVVGHGLFPPDLVHTVFVARGNEVERFEPVSG